MIDIAILGLLKEHDLHGYELRKRLDELPGSRPTVSFGSLYPALNRLERAGHVKAVTFETSPTPAAPMSGSLTGELAAFRAHRKRAATSPGGRGKKVYGLTDQGDQRLRELLVDPDVADDRAFEARVAFCHHLTTSERLALFEARRGELARRRDQVARRAGGADTGVAVHVRSLFERDAAAITADLAWLDGLIAAERADESEGRASQRGAGNRRDDA
jgi:DNA-binding PadR family transcriptional regulator